MEIMPPTGRSRLTAPFSSSAFARDKAAAGLAGRAAGVQNEAQPTPQPSS